MQFPQPKKHTSAITDIKQAAELLRALDGFRGTFPVQCALRLAPMLFCRPGELRKMEWSDDAAEWRYVVSKTKTDHLVPMASQAVKILNEIYPLTGHGRYVFPGARDHQKPEVIEHQLAHKVPDALGTAYNRTKFLKERKAMMQLWADYLDKLKAGAEIIKLPVAA